MIANYHTHTWRCNHAEGTEREYVERAIEGGIRILGFSDHTPYAHLSTPDNGVRMQMKQMDDYADTILALKEEYKDEIEIHLGVEAEYYPRYFEELMRFFEDYPVEYLLLGQHFLGNELAGDPYSGSRSADPMRLRRYVDQSIEAMETGAFLYMAHPDLLRFDGDPEIYDKEYRRLCIAAKERNLPLEINFLGIGGKRWYPDQKFWKIAGEVGNLCIFGCDAHCAVNVWNPEVEEKALDIVKKNHLVLLDKMEL